MTSVASAFPASAADAASGPGVRAENLDDAQRAVVASAIGASGVVVGAPGTGKTTAVVARVVDDGVTGPAALLEQVLASGGIARILCDGGSGKSHCSEGRGYLEFHGMSPVTRLRGRNYSGKGCGNNRLSRTCDQLAVPA